MITNSRRAIVVVKESFIWQVKDKFVAFYNRTVRRAPQAGPHTDSVNRSR